MSASLNDLRYFIILSFLSFFFLLQFKIGYDEMLTRTLWLAMWNHDTFGHNDFLGEVMLPLDTYQESGFTWEDPSPNWYPLQERVSGLFFFVFLWT